MTIQTINLGNYANDGTGDDLRTAFQKVNANFTFLGTSTVHGGINLGTGTGVLSQLNGTTSNLEFKSLTSTDNSIEITNTSSTVNLKGLSRLENDPAPKLNAHLNLNNYHVLNGDIQTNVWGVDMRNISSLLELVITSNPSVFVMDMNGIYTDTHGFGTDDPSGTTWDFDFNGPQPIHAGFSIADPAGLNLDFGSIST